MLEKVFELVKDERDDTIEKHNRSVDASVLKIIRQAEKKKKA